MSIHMHPQIPPPACHARALPVDSEQYASWAPRPKRQQAVRFESGLPSGDSPRDTLESLMPNRTQDKLRRFGQNTLGVCSLMATCCLLPCTKGR